MEILCLDRSVPAWMASMGMSRHHGMRFHGIAIVVLHFVAVIVGLVGSALALALALALTLLASICMFTTFSTTHSVGALAVVSIES